MCTTETTSKMIKFAFFSASKCQKCNIRYCRQFLFLPFFIKKQFSLEHFECKFMHFSYNGCNLYNKTFKNTVLYTIWHSNLDLKSVAKMQRNIRYAMVTNHLRAPYGVYFTKNRTILRRPAGGRKNRTIFYHFLRHRTVPGEV